MSAAAECIPDLVNRQVRLKSRPAAIPQAEHFEIVTTPVPAVAEGEVLVRNVYVSVEPAMRGWVSAVANYSEPVAIGAVMRSFAVGRVVMSRNAGYREGEYVTGMFGWQDYAIVAGAAIDRKVESAGLPVSTALGVLGLNGLTAYLALLDIGQPTSGETVVVSTAAGSVGSCAGQIAKLKGCRTIGIAGGPEKVRLCLEEFGFDAAIDYKAETPRQGPTTTDRTDQRSPEVRVDLEVQSFESRLAASCPNGVDIYFDNTAGRPLATVTPHLANGARVDSVHLKDAGCRVMGERVAKALLAEGVLAPVIR